MVHDRRRIDRFLLMFAVRGHRPQPDPRGLSAEAFAEAVRMRDRPGREKRWLGGPVRNLAAAVLHGLCDRRGGRCLAVVVERTFMMAVVELPLDPWRRWTIHGLCDATRMVVTKRAKRASLWPWGESVFTPVVLIDALQGQDQVEAAVRAIKGGGLGEGEAERPP